MRISEAFDLAYRHHSNGPFLRDLIAAFSGDPPSENRRRRVIDILLGELGRGGHSVQAQKDIIAAIRTSAAGDTQELERVNRLIPSFQERGRAATK
jgi:hypothetical protein